MDDKRDSSCKPASIEPLAAQHWEGRVLSSAELFGRRQEIVIIHEGEEYRLRITRNNKLILTK